MPAIAIVALTGPILSGSIFFYYASTASEISVALIGLVGTCISSGTAVFITVRTAQRVKRVEKKVSSPRRISAQAGESGAVVVQPPDTEETEKRWR